MFVEVMECLCIVSAGGLPSTERQCFLFEFIDIGAVQDGYGRSCGWTTVDC